MEADECAVCFTSESTGRVHPCEHPICKSCMLTWIERNQYTCPMCRQPVFGLMDDDTKDAHMVIDFPPDSHAGVTIGNAKTGVRVLSTNKRDRASSCGLKRGHVITHINSVPVTTHEIAVRFFDHAANRAEELKLHLKGHDTEVRRCGVWWARSNVMRI